jgi:hypothetical protein
LRRAFHPAQIDFFASVPSEERRSKVQLLKLLSKLSTVAALGLLLASACTGDPAQSVADGDLVVEDVGDGVMQLHSASAPTTAIPDGTAGEDPSAKGDIGVARDCSFVQWCNEPGPRGTICRARPECGCSGVIECNDEVRRICGGFVDPAYFLCPGQP